jgi:hypothetical protein
MQQLNSQKEKLNAIRSIMTGKPMASLRPPKTYLTFLSDDVWKVGSKVMDHGQYENWKKTLRPMDTLLEFETSGAPLINQNISEQKLLTDYQYAEVVPESELTVDQKRARVTARLKNERELNERNLAERYAQPEPEPDHELIAEQKRQEEMRLIPGYEWRIAVYENE